MNFSQCEKQQNGDKEYLGELLSDILWHILLRRSWSSIPILESTTYNKIPSFSLFLCIYICIYDICLLQIWKKKTNKFWDYQIYL